MKKTDITIDAIVIGAAVFLFFASVALSFKSGLDYGTHRVRVEAVEQHAAEWVTDSGGRSSFRWQEDRP